MFRAISVLTLWVMSLALLACGDDRPNVVLITLDHTPADRFGIYGNEEAQTPNFDGFARNAVLYEKAYATSSASFSSHASLMTGLHPMQHGARARLEGGSGSSRLLPLSERATTFAERLQARGLETAAIVANPDLLADFGVAQGFEHYDDTLATSFAKASEFPSAKGNAKAIADLAIQRLADFGPDPFLLFVDFFDPRAASASVVAELDLELGRLLAAIEASPRAEQTLIAITADTGTRGEFEGNLHENAVRVPLALRYPAGSGGPANLESGKRIDTATQNHRLFATILEAVGLALPEELKLHSLAGRDTLIFTEIRRPRDRAQESQKRPRELRALYLFPFKLIQTRAGDSEFYNLDRDPAEAHSIVEEAPKAYSRLLKLLIQFAEAHPPLFDDANVSNVWRASVDKLESLGTVE